MLFEKIEQGVVPFDPTLNDMVISMADRFVGEFVVSCEAPSSYEELKLHMDDGNIMVVYDGGSENTIFGDPNVNWAFRAWHDWCHWRGEYDFSVYGEEVTLNMQCDHIASFYGNNSKTEHWKSLLSAEVVGQRLYYEYHREYVVDQRAFVSAYLLNREAALQCMW